jgi:glucose/arabinose dehydrogenase
VASSVPVSTSTTVAPATSPTTEPTATSSPQVADVPELAGLTYHVVSDELPFPIILMPWKDSASLVAFRDGRIHAFDGSTIIDEPVVALSVGTGGERGLLGIETSPDDPDLLYVHYSNPAGDSIVSEISLGSGTERILLEVAQPAGNHNGGMIQFGPDGHLYLGLGDGGGANDQFGHGQNTETLLGGIVRIDPIEGDAELWSYGLRNPFRFWFDGGDLYIGDVGQGAFEEVNAVAFDPAGFNFGWPITEALHCFSPRSGCDVEGITLPVVEIAHGDGGACAVTGGVVYRGEAIPELDGRYLYSDYCGGWLRSFRFDGAEATERRDWTDQVGVPGRVVSFGMDHRGEVYVLTTTAILRIDPVR